MAYKTIGIDMGNYHIKTSENLVFKATYTTAANTDTLSQQNSITLNGVTYFIEKGSFDTELNKSQKDTLPLFLYALAKSTDANVVKVVVGLPVNQFTDENKARMSSKFTGKFKFSVNGEERDIVVKQVKCFMECVGAYYNLDGVDNKEIILVDIGGRTTNFAHFYRGEHMKSTSIADGMFNLLDKIKNKLNADYSLDLSRERAADILDDMFFEVKGLEVNLSFIHEFKQELTSAIVEELKLNYPTNLATPVLLGGGAKVMHNSFTQIRVSILQDCMFANADGFKVIADIVFEN